MGGTLQSLDNVMSKYIYYDAVSIVNTVFFKKALVCVYMCMHACKSYMLMGAHGSQKRLSDPLALESQAVVSHLA